MIRSRDDEYLREIQSVAVALRASADTMRTNAATLDQAADSVLARVTDIKNREVT